MRLLTHGLSGRISERHRQHPPVAASGFSWNERAIPGVGAWREVDRRHRAPRDGGAGRRSDRAAGDRAREGRRRPRYALAARILEREHHLYPLAIQLLLNGGWRVEGRRFRDGKIGVTVDSRPLFHALFSVITDTSGGQFSRYGTYTVPTPRLTKIDVLSRRPVPATTGNFFAAIAPMPGQHHLAAVGVTRQHQRDVQRGRLVEPARIVREQDDRRLRAADQPRDIARAPRPEADADEVDLFAADCAPSCARRAAPHSRAR